MICHLAFSTLVYCGGAAREEDGRQEGEERCGRDHLKFFRHSKPERGGNILDQGFISLDAQDSIGSTTQNWWPTKPTPHVSLPSDALINVGHKSSFSQSHQTRPANVTEPQVKVVEKEASSRQAVRQALRQAENRWQQQQAESQEPQGETCRWLLRLTRAACSPTGEPSLPLANTKVVQEQIQSGTYTQILRHVYITVMHIYVHKDSCLNTDFLS